MCVMAPPIHLGAWSMYRLTHGLLSDTGYIRSCLQYCPRVVLKTAEGISGIAEEGRGLTYLYPRTVGKREKANLAVH